MTPSSWLTLTANVPCKLCWRIFREDGQLRVRAKWFSPFADLRLFCDAGNTMRREKVQVRLRDTACNRFALLAYAVNQDSQDSWGQG
jgi:hypothetical protein